MIASGPEGPLRAGWVRAARPAVLLAAFALGIAATILWQNLGAVGPLFRSERVPRVVLIGLDGADWNLIDPLVAAGRMPNLEGLLKRGVRGRVLTINPTLSPVIWTSIGTGVKPERHGIVDFTAVNKDTGEAVPVTSNLRRVPALWNLISEAGFTVGVVGWWASFPAERVDGYIVSDRIAYQLFGVKPDANPEGKTWPRDAYEAIEPLVVDPKSLPREMLARFFDDPTVLDTADPEEREILDQFRTIVASSESYRRISAALSRKYRTHFESVYFEGTDTVAHLFMKFRPPQMPGVSAESVRRFGGILDRFYVYVDELIGEIVERGGDGVTYVVCSDHGFRSDRDRPITTESRIDRGRGADWHRKYGILLVAGPGARRGSEIREATVYDLAPTILALAGAPVPHDLDGRVLTDAISEEFLRAHPVRTRETAADGAPAPAGGAAPVATEDDEEIREKLISLGYLTQESKNAHNNRGILLLGRGELDQAIAEFRAAMADNPDFAAGYVNIARAYWQKGEEAAAIENLAKAGRIDPRMREVPLMLGNIALKARRLDEAESHFRRALELEPNDTDTLNCLGLVYEARGDRDRAEIHFRKAVEVDADYAEGYNNLGNISKKRGDDAQAESWYRRAIDADPFFMGAYANLALVYQERGDFDRAAELYRQALDKDNANPDLHNNLGSLLFRRGDLKGAEESFRRALALDGKYAEGHNSLGVVYGALGKDREERAAYEKAIEIRPDYADALYNLALWFIRHEDDREGERRLRQVLQIQPTYVAALGTMAGIRIRHDDPAGARAFLEQALGIQPANPRLLALLGEACFRTGDRSCAERAFRRSLEIQPGQKEVEERLRSLLDSSSPE